MMMGVGTVPAIAPEPCGPVSDGGAHWTQDRPGGTGTDERESAMIITVEMLRKAGACKPEIDRLVSLYGEHVDVTEAWVLEHAHDRVDWAWAAENLLSEPAWRAYKEAIAPAQRAYWEATESAWRAYTEATEPARRALGKAKADARRAFEEACAVAFARVLNA